MTRAEFGADICDIFYNKKNCHHLHVGNHTPVGNYTMMEDKKKTIEIEKVEYEKDLGPVVQSVVSLTSSLRVISLTVLADSIYNILIFFAEKM